MSANNRKIIASIGSGMLGAAVCGIWIYARTALLPVYPPLNAGISLPIALTSGFLCYLLAYQSYEWSGYLLGSVFGGMGGLVSGAATEIGYLLSFDQVPHGVMELFSSGIVGAILGGLSGSIAGFIFCPLLAKFADSQ